MPKVIVLLQKKLCGIHFLMILVRLLRLLRVKWCLEVLFGPRKPIVC